MADSTTLKEMFIGTLRDACRVGNPKPAKGLSTTDFDSVLMELEHALLEADRNGERRVQNAIREALKLPLTEGP